ncbi:MAG: AAA family ATPase [Planctomycetota bacterium]
MISKLDQYPIDTSVRQFFARVENLAFQRQHTEVTPAHLIHCVADIEVFGQALLGPAHSAGKIQEMRKRADRAVDPVAGQPACIEVTLDETVAQILQSAVQQIQQTGAPYITVEHLVLALLYTDEVCNEFIPLDERQWRHADSAARERLRSRRTSVIAHTPTLDLYGEDLTQRVRRGDIPWPICGRRAELLAIQRIVMRRTKRNPLLVGPAGSGKTALLTGLAASFLDNATFGQYRIVELDLTSLIAGTIYRGELEARIKRILKELRENPTVMLGLDELHLLQSGGSDTSPHCAEYFKAALASGDLSVIGATCPENLHILFRDSAIQRRFEPVFIEPLDNAALRQVLKCVRASLSQYYQDRFQVQMEVSEDVLEEIPILAADIMPGRTEPDASITLLQDAVTAALVPPHGIIDFASTNRIRVDLHALEDITASLRRTQGLLTQALTADHCNSNSPNTTARVSADTTPNTPSTF